MRDNIDQPLDSEDRTQEYIWAMDFERAEMPIASLLGNLGITRYGQLADMSAANLHDAKLTDGDVTEVRRTLLQRGLTLIDDRRIEYTADIATYQTGTENDETMATVVDMEARRRYRARKFGYELRQRQSALPRQNHWQ